jgi:predicted unusual protein kinase regulating ubiquinone biosynthesis (AarF/ABC1/UbiB family)
MSNAPPSSKLKRGAVSGMALAHAGIVRLGHQARQITRGPDEQEAARALHEAELGKILFRALNQLKGTALKVSQLLCMEADFLPAGIRNELAKACYQVTPLNRALVHKVFRQEFGQAPEHLFAQFDSHSFAAASLGQVHHAQLADGTALAVKLQYPGIAAAIGSDIRMLRGILLSLRLGSDLLPRQELIDRVMHEIAHKLTEELDYRHEAGQLAWFQEHLRLPGIVIPRSIASLSSQRILTMQHLPGLHIDEWLATNPTQTEREHYGQLLFDWFWYSVLSLGRIHADPHPGNFLFMPDGQLGVIDFGCTKQLAPEFGALMAQAWRALLQTTPDYAALRQSYIALGLVAPELSLSDFETLLLPAITPLITWQLEPYRRERFDFANKSPYPNIDRSHSKTLAQIHVGFHDDLPYFDRANLGLMHMLKKIGATVNTNIAWNTTSQGAPTCNN